MEVKSNQQFKLINHNYDGGTDIVPQRLSDFTDFFFEFRHNIRNVFINEAVHKFAGRAIRIMLDSSRFCDIYHCNGFFKWSRKQLHLRQAWILHDYDSPKFTIVGLSSFPHIHVEWQNFVVDKFVSVNHQKEVQIKSIN